MKALPNFRFALTILICAAIAACQPATTAIPTSTAGPNVQPSSGDLCANPYVPVVEGATWAYTVSTGSTATTQVDTITDAGNDGFLVETMRPDSSSVITWHCTAEGLFWLQSDGGQFSAVFQGEAGSQTWETLSNSGVTLPRDPQPGDSWTSTEQVQVTGAGVNQPYTITIVSQAIGMESIDVPAGSFNALRVDFQMTWDYEQDGVATTFVQSGSTWLAAGVGIVQQTGHVEGIFDSVQALESYSIP